MGLLGDARCPQRKMAARAGRPGTHGEIRKYHLGPVRPDGRILRLSTPPGLFNFAYFVGIGDMYAVWASSADGKVPCAGGGRRGVARRGAPASAWYRPAR